MDSLGYTADWKDISRRRRESENWKCSNCSVSCADGNLRWMLDVHHVNRNKQDNTDVNLRVLCRLCHREEGFQASSDDHEQLVTSDPGRWKLACKLIQDARTAQGIMRSIPPAFKI